MASLKISLLITLALSITGLAFEHSMESKVIAHITDTGQIEKALASGASHRLDQQGVASPSEIAHESVNMSYQYIAQSLPLPSQDLIPHGLNLGKYYDIVARHFLG